MDRNWSVSAKKVQPRISLITAIDSQHGNVYFAVSLNNTNKNMMGLFIQHLCLKLDKENRYWRNNSVLLWDVSKRQRNYTH